MNLNEKYEHIIQDLLQEKSDDPIAIVQHIMTRDYISMHGPEHHFLDGAALLVALYNKGLVKDLSKQLDTLAQRSIKMPGAMCGHWGICGSSASIGAALSVFHETGPLSHSIDYKEHMALTSSIIAREGQIGGPRCCKRNAFIALSTAVQFIKETYGIELTNQPVKCLFSQYNSQCLHSKCPFHIEKEQSL
ncbi:hypothetical protein H6A09_07405 [[Clostridium] spiroforme]|nr:hypothetical protein [Thomasclavelia spiroformis]